MTDPTPESGAAAGGDPAARIAELRARLDAAVRSAEITAGVTPPDEPTPSTTPGGGRQPHFDRAHAEARADLACALAGEGMGDLSDPAARQRVDEIVELLTAALAYWPDDDARLGRLAGVLGAALMARLFHSGDETADRAAAIGAFERALVVAEPGEIAAIHCALGQLHGSRALPVALFRFYGQAPTRAAAGALPGMDILNLLTGLGEPADPEGLADLDRGIAHLRAALAAEVRPPGLDAIAQGILGVLLLTRMMRQPSAVNQAEALAALGAAAQGMQAVEGLPAGFDLLPLLEGLITWIDLDPDVGRTTVPGTPVPPGGDGGRDQNAERAADPAPLASASEAVQEPAPGSASASASESVPHERAPEPEPDEAISRLRRAAATLPPNHMLRYLLNDSLGERLAERVLREGSPDDVRAALDALSADPGTLEPAHPLYPLSLRRRLGAQTSATMLDLGRSGLDALAGLIAEVEKLAEDDPTAKARDDYMKGALAAVGALVEENTQGVNAAVTSLLKAGKAFPPDDDFQLVVLSTAGGLLMDRGLLHGVQADAETAAEYLLRVDDVIAAMGPATGGKAAALAGLRGSYGLVRVFGAVGLPTATEDERKTRAAKLTKAVESLRTSLGEMRRGMLGRPAVLFGLGLGLIHLGFEEGQRGSMIEGARLFLEAADEPAVDATSRPSLYAAAGLGAALTGVLSEEPAAIDRGVERLLDALELESQRAGENSRIRAALGAVLLARHDLSGASSDLDAAIDQMELARGAGGGEVGFAASASTLWQLFDALLRAPNGERRRRAAVIGHEAMRATVADALMQTRLDHSMATAHLAVQRAYGVVELVLGGPHPAEPAEADVAQTSPEAVPRADVIAAMDALELSRGLVLHSATSTATLPELLEQAGRGHLAERCGKVSWSAAIPGDIDGGQQSSSGREATLRGLAAFLAEPEGPPHLWPEVFDALRSIRAHGTSPLPAEVVEALVAPPRVETLAAALRETGQDCLAYLLPGEGRRPGRVLLLHADGRVDALRADGLAVDIGPLPAYTAALGAAGAARAAVDAVEHDRGSDQGPDRDARLAAVEASRQAQLAWRGALDRVCDWAGEVVMGRLLDRVRRDRSAVARPVRLVLVPCGELGVVPWHAARVPTARGPRGYVCEEAVISYLATGRQLVRVVSRPIRPLLERPVFVVPDRAVKDRYWVSETVRMVLPGYENAVAFGGRLIGRVAGTVRGPGTPEEILAEFVAAEGPPSLLYIGSHGATDKDPLSSHIDLAWPDDGAADDGRLRVGRILQKRLGRWPDTAGRRAADTRPPGGLTVLTACSSDLAEHRHDEALTLATALLAAGDVGVVGSRWDIQEHRTAVLMVVFHSCLRQLRSSGAGGAADALRAAQLWMIDPTREPPCPLPTRLVDDVRARLAEEGDDLTAVWSWAAFSFQGADHRVGERRAGEERVGVLAGAESSEGGSVDAGMGAAGAVPVAGRGTYGTG